MVFVNDENVYNSLRWELNGWHFADISKGLIVNKAGLVHVMALHLTGDKPWL